MMKSKYFKLLIAAFAFLFILVACGNDNDDTPADEADYEEVNGDEEENGDEVEAGEVVRVALLAHSDDSILDDGSFNQGAWDGITRFYESLGLNVEDHALFFQPHEASDEARIDLIQDAVNDGFDVLVLPGFHFEVALYEAQEIFTDTTFILLDASPRHGDTGVRIEDNVVAIHYAEEEAGFLAGYAAVMEGFTDLGFMGGLPVPAVIRFGHGFIQGADHAAESLGLAAGDITINFTYLGGFAPTPERQAEAVFMFAGGTEVIFAAAGGAGGSVMAAAEQEGGIVIGVDVDQSEHSSTVITSAVKGLEISVYDMLNDFNAGNFNGGRELMFNAAIDGVSLPMGTARFENFTQDQYDAIFALLANGDIVVNASTDMDDITTTLVTVNVLD
ncbi:MAG: BMP family ABC transporter substrate-binding protein [Turicibacter sp.]|nr:BMP family ABC transporter substrate-binding protein [Turicibacter sp.]